MSGTGTEQSNNTEPSDLEELFERWIHTVGDVTLPVLAGFSVTSVIIVSDDAANFRWPGGTILALTIASITLIAAIQGSGHARLYFSSRTKISQAGVSHADKAMRWARLTRFFYHCGIVALLAGLSLALAPIHGKGMQDILRWSASVAAFASCVGEAVYISRRWAAPRG